MADIKIMTIHSLQAFVHCTSRVADGILNLKRPVTSYKRRRVALLSKPVVLAAVRTTGLDS